MPATRARTGLDEFGLIDRYFKPLANSPAALGLTDDTAILSPPADEELVMTADMVAEGVHCLPDDKPASIARKALRVNLSDLAAKGATPVGYLLSVALPETNVGAWLRGFTRGLKGDQATYGIDLLGGDTIRSGTGKVTVSITGIGRVPKGKAVLRSGARPGDILMVSGTLGDAMAGLALRRGDLSASDVGRGRGHLLDRYLHPQPRTALAAALRRHAHAAVDISDGLMADLGHLCAASGLTATVEASRLPLSAPLARLVERDGDWIGRVATGGDDYEILSAVSPSHVTAFRGMARRAGVAVTEIGHMAKGGAEPVLQLAGGVRLSAPSAGHVHF